QQARCRLERDGAGWICARLVDRHGTDWVAGTENLQDHVGSTCGHFRNFDATADNREQRVRRIALAEERLALVELPNVRHRRETLAIVRRQPPKNGRLPEDLVKVQRHGLSAI